MDQYNDAVQHPQTAFSDPSLKSGRVASNGFGIPVALGGGFAITYTVTSQGKKYAVRCFHKATNKLEERYAKISRGLLSAGGPYFVGFEYQSSGVLVNGSRYPIVKMDWAEGDTLGTFLETYHSDQTRLTKLRTDFQDLEKFLRLKGLAHGDLQNGNVIVSNYVRLIDYDGMYVPDLPCGKGTETGHRHFQHPRRGAADFGPDMDRFSFIVIDLSLRALTERPTLFSKFSNGENILFAASDYADPSNSPVFAELRGIPGLKRDAENLARLCGAAIRSVPSVEDFLAGRNIPAEIVVVARPQAPAGPAVYIGAYDVLDATDFDAIMRYVGDRIELVGLITDVRVDKTRYGKPYVFLNFGPWRGRIAKINIWSEGLAKLPKRPDESWIGRWISVTGLVDAPYSSRRYHYTHLSITITEANQIREITSAEATRRLMSGVGGASSGRVSGNREILEGLTGTSGHRTATHTKRGKRGRAGKGAAAPVQRRTKNQDILDGIRKTAPRMPHPAQPSRYQPKPPEPGSNFLRWIKWIGVVAFLLWLFLGK